MIETAAPRLLVDASGVASAIGRMADELSRDLPGQGPVFLAGIPTRGVVVAERLVAALADRGIAAESGMVDISMYRDDLGMRHEVDALRGTRLPLDLEPWNVVLVDDVQHTGRTARAAIEAVLAFGRPRRILYAVLADRGGRELPVRPDFTGVHLEVADKARVKVKLAPIDAEAEGIYES